MTSILSLRRFLSILVMAVSLSLVGLAPVAAARVQAPAHHRRVPSSGTFGDSPLAPLWHVLHSMWAAVGSSMDPLGIH